METAMAEIESVYSVVQVLAAFGFVNFTGLCQKISYYFCSLKKVYKVFLFFGKKIYLPEMGLLYTLRRPGGVNVLASWALLTVYHPQVPPGKLVSGIN